MEEETRAHVCAVILALFVSLFTACDRKQIQGSVRDPFGKGIEGVTVKIEKSGFVAVTDHKGQYSLDYAPGTFTLNFSKPSYTTQRLELTISQKASFPAEAVEMFPMPSGQRIFYIGGDQLLEIPRGAVKRIEGQSFFSFGQARYYASESKLSVRPGQMTFMDAVPKPLRLARLGRDRLIMDAGLFMGSPTNVKYSGFLSDDSKQVGEEKVLLRKVDLQPGKYAWVEIVTSVVDAQSPGKICYPFAVEPAEVPAGN